MRHLDPDDEAQERALATLMGLCPNRAVRRAEKAEARAVPNVTDSQRALKFRAFHRPGGVMDRTQQASPLPVKLSDRDRVAIAAVRGGESLRVIGRALNLSHEWVRRLATGTQKGQGAA